MVDEFHITGIGEILWDMFPDGAQFGGAPANFVCHSQALGARSHMVSCVGNDELGRRALGHLKEARRGHISGHPIRGTWDRHR